MFRSARALAILTFLGTAMAAIATPNFGTKQDPIPSAPVAGAPNMGYMPMLQMLLALGIVLVLIKFVLPKFMGKLSKKFVAKSGGGILIEDTASFAGGQLYVVSVRGKSLLLSASQSGVSCLADLTEARPRAEQPLFMDMLQRETYEPSHLYVQESGEPTPVMKAAMTEDEIQAAIERLNRLGG
jgi:flagellar biogenesis protein FliO